MMIANLRGKTHRFGFQSSINQAKFHIVKLLTSEWLVSESDPSNADPADEGSHTDSPDIYS